MSSRDAQQAPKIPRPKCSLRVPKVSPETWQARGLPGQTKSQKCAHAFCEFTTSLQTQRSYMLATAVWAKPTWTHIYIYIYVLYIYIRIYVYIYIYEYLSRSKTEEEEDEHMTNENVYIYIYIEREIVHIYIYIYTYTWWLKLTDNTGSVRQYCLLQESFTDLPRCMCNEHLYQTQIS